MKIYHDLLNHILTNGKERTDRTGVGTLSVFGYHMRHNLADGFPLLTTKKMHLKSVIHELLWILSGSTNNNDLTKHGVTIWREWEKEDGDLGPIYGKQFRSWACQNGETVDQIKSLVEGLKTDPMSRRHIVSAWNVSDLDDMALPPCHCLFQFYCDELTEFERKLLWKKKMRRDFASSYNPITSKSKKTWDDFFDAAMKADGIPKYRLSCQLYQRSGDAFLGIPYNIASYSLLTMMLAQVCNMVAGEFIHTIGDAHLYKNHLDQARLQLTRECRPLPKMTLNPIVSDIDDFKYEDFTLSEYNPHPHIKAEVAV